MGQMRRVPYAAGSGSFASNTATRPAQRSTLSYKIGIRKTLTEDKEVKMLI
jgi:hypothetical protein